MKRFLIWWFLALLVLATPPTAGAKQVRAHIPMTLGYPFLRAMLLQQSFDQPGAKALVLNRDQGCTLIEMWDPKVRPHGSLLEIDSAIRFKVGLKVGQTCLDPVDWQGRIVLHQSVRTDRINWRLIFSTQDSELRDPKGEPATVANAVWSLVSRHVHAYMDGFTVSLAVPRREMDLKLPLFFSPSLRSQVKKWLQSLSLGPGKVTSRALVVPMSMEVELPEEKEQEQPEPAEPKPLSPEVMDAFTNYWQIWDAYLVAQIRSLNHGCLSQKDREDLWAALLDTRYGFVQALQDRDPNRDLVREQFVKTWRSLGPIFRKCLLSNPSPSLFNYLSFITASDALAALDKLGPSLGLDISSEGLARLATLAHKGGMGLQLKYNYQLDQDLRKALGLGQELKPSGSATEEEQLDDPGYLPHDMTTPQKPHSWLDWLSSPAWAAKPPDETLSQVIKWIPDRRDYPSYLAKVRKMLGEVTQNTLAQSGLDKEMREMFLELIPAAAWQESCYRQFLRSRGKITFLRSYNHSSVGIMQVNERVWRGLYHRASLRWDIVYNARAGCEIMMNFLKRYALKRDGGGKDLDADLLSRALYAMYNGGPSQYEKFMKRVKRGRLYLSDRLFEEKLRWEQSGQHDRALDCLPHHRD